MSRKKAQTKKPDKGEQPIAPTEPKEKKYNIQVLANIKLEYKGRIYKLPPCIIFKPSPELIKAARGNSYCKIFEVE